MTNTLFKRALLLMLLVSSVVGFASAIPAPVPTVPMSAPNALQNAEWDFQAMLPIVMSAFTAVLGSNGFILVSGIILCVLVAIVWIRTENSIIPMIMIVVYSFTMVLGNWCPAEWQLYLVILGVLMPGVSVLYEMFKSHR